MAAKILVIDDDKDIQRLLATSPDLILLDLGLPAGDGFTVLERLQARPNLSRIPVIVLSGSDPSHARTRALDAGADRFLEEPIAHEELLATVGLSPGE